MIDAYEIGIQLVIQDEVSAGLGVISRELAEVDRAIAATSAGLANLSHAAQTAVAAAAAVGGARAPVAASAPKESTSEIDGAELVKAPRAESGAVEVGQGPRAEPDTPPAAAPVATPVSRPAPETEDRREERTGGTATAEARSGAAAPIATVAAAPASVSPAVRTDVVPTGVAPVQSAGMMQQAAPQPRARETLAERPVAAAPVARLDAVARTRADRPSGLITASVAQAVAPRVDRSTVQQRQSAGALSVVAVGGEVPRQSAAPWSGIEHRTAMPREARLQQKAAAPQPQVRDGGEGGGGTVMLDGRLVGYWVSEQMARDASRPPGGTSFFDPRQAPAWTASGAL